MPEPVLTLLKLAFLGILYLFLFYAVRAMTRDVRSARDTEAGLGNAAPRGARPGTIYLVESPGEVPRSLPLMPELSVGRSESCDLSLPGDNFISQFQARFTLHEGTCFVEDLGSTNGTYLNGSRIDGPVEVSRGDRVTFGKTVLELRK